MSDLPWVLQQACGGAGAGALVRVLLCPSQDLPAEAHSGVSLHQTPFSITFPS